MRRPLAQKLVPSRQKSLSHVGQEYQNESIGKEKGRKRSKDWAGKGK